MKLIDFVKEFICPNSIIRLLTKISSGHEIIAKEWDDVSMEWQLIKGKSIYNDYSENEVVGITDIHVGGKYSEAINIVIKK